MGILDNFERGLERVVNGAFAKTFRSGLQPVELTSALRKELDTKAAVVARDRVLAPNRFILRMSAPDYERMLSMGAALTDELVDFVQKHAREQHYQFAGGISIELAEDPDIAEGMLQVDSENVKGDVAWKPVLEIDGRHYQLGPRTIVGRGSDADITVEDTGISRRHILITWDGRRAQVEDLGSTNGSKLNGEPVSKALLEPEDVITIGRTRLAFRVLPQAAPQAPASRADDPTRRHDLGDFWSTS